MLSFAARAVRQGVWQSGAQLASRPALAGALLIQSRGAAGPDGEERTSSAEAPAAAAAAAAAADATNATTQPPAAGAAAAPAAAGQPPEAAAAPPADQPPMPGSLAAGSLAGSSGTDPSPAAGSSSSEAHEQARQVVQQYFGATARAEIKRLHSIQEPVRQTLGAPPTGLFAWLGRLLAARAQARAEQVVRQQVERSFSADDFCQGALEAMQQVRELSQGRDWETLRPMLTPLMFEAMHSAAEAVREAGFEMQAGDVEGAEAEAWLTGAQLWTSQQVAVFDPAAVAGAAVAAASTAAAADAAAAAGAPAAAAAAGPAGRWLVTAVSLRQPRRQSILRSDSAQLLVEATNLKPQTLFFARGPLPEGAAYPVDALEGLPWTLLSNSQLLSLVRPLVK